MSAPLPIDPAQAADLVASPRWGSKIAVAENGCWVFTGAGIRNGYGQIHLGGRMVMAHRIALVAALGRDLLPGMQAGHACHDQAFAAGLCVATQADPCQHRRCVNPDHLAEQSPAQNSLSGGTIVADQAARTHCPNGHPLEGDNLRARELARGCRACLTCDRERKALMREAHLALGLTQREYRATYGSSRATAQRLLGVS